MKSVLPPLKRFGQNFLTDKNIIAKIIAVSEVSAKDHVFEIGPGRGALTLELARAARQVTAVEIDHGLVRYLKEICGDLKNVKIFRGDVLKFNFKRYACVPKKRRRFKVVANLPYYITTPIIEFLVKNVAGIDDIFIMVQKEVGDRMKASPGSKIFGSFTCFVNYYFDVRLLFKIKAASFCPAPKVDSSFMGLTPRKNPRKFFGVKSQELLFRVIRCAFGQRRKRLYGALSKFVDTEALKTLPCQDLLERRAEELGLLDFVLLSNVIFDFCRWQ
jgi:16S rRNA (adenine1518-N6/adenine1519-N6)-dimethyltransferase